MNTHIRQRWASALRSGRFRQCEGYERFRGPDGVAHCALGVLGALYEEEMGHHIFERLAGDPGGDRISDSAAFGRWAGIADWPRARGEDGDFIDTITRMNDGDDVLRAHAFPAIANFIESFDRELTFA